MVTFTAGFGDEEDESNGEEESDDEESNDEEESDDEESEEKDELTSLRMSSARLP
jgi:hypothetical protein